MKRHALTGWTLAICRKDEGSIDVDVFLCTPRARSAIQEDGSDGGAEPELDVKGPLVDFDDTKPSSTRAGNVKAEGEDGEKEKRTRRRRTPHQQHLNKLCQRRYRERQKNKMIEMEGIVKKLDEKSALLAQAQIENDGLRGMNQRLQLLVREQQELLTTLNGTGVSQVAGEDMGFPLQQIPEPSTSFHSGGDELIYGGGPQKRGPEPAILEERASWTPNQNDPIIRATPAAPSGQVQLLPTARSALSGDLWPLGAGVAGSILRSKSTGLSSSAGDPKRIKRLKTGEPPLAWPSEYVEESVSAAMFNPPITTGHKSDDDEAPFGGSLRDFKRARMRLFSSNSYGPVKPVGSESPPVLLVGADQPSMQQSTNMGAVSLPIQSTNVGAMSLPMQSVQPGFAGVGPQSPTMGGQIAAEGAPVDVPDWLISAPGDASAAVRDMAAQVQDLRNVLEANGIFMGGVHAGDELVGTLVAMLSRTAEHAVRVIKSRVPRGAIFGGGSAPELRTDLAPEERVGWEKCVTILNLDATQRGAVLGLRAEHLQRLQRIYEERARLNEEARSLKRASDSQQGYAPDSLSFVWDRLKQNLRQEHQVVIDGLRVLLFRILGPVQAALLVVEAHPGDVELMKLSAAILSLGGGGSCQRSSSSGSLGAANRERSALDG
ncbi:unnamed protein product [Ostreobium quekettii]|uniref:BZIP domain-containing protein n=1 Tax=Ostreobium quekettii TaxID=121088 RepID=A0A8S1JG36_9CHLO|nr:unnamed protein product [Ostreobium quekettii]